MSTIDPSSSKVTQPETGEWTRLLKKVRAAFVRLHGIEIGLVRHQARCGRRCLVRPIAVGVNWLGNGLLYPGIAAALLWAQGPKAVRVVLTAGLTVGLAHSVYPCIKRWIARERPCHAERGLPSLQGIMDQYSFPSGHCMTATGAAIPITTAFPDLTAPAVALCALVMWGRLASAHHYPSDLVAGTALGAACAWPITSMLL